MKKYIFGLIGILVILLFIPLVWKYEEQVIFDWPNFTEEYYKSWFGLIQIILGFSFFTLLYEHLNKKKNHNRIFSIKKRIENKTDIFSQEDILDSEFEKNLRELDELLIIFNDSVNQVELSDDKLILFFEFTKELKIMNRNLVQNLNNNDARLISINDIQKLIKESSAIKQD